MAMTERQVMQVEFTLSEDGRLFYRGCSDPEIIYELSCRAAEQARAYQKFQTRQDPIALCLVGLAASILLALAYQIVSRPAPEYTPRYQNYAAPNRIL
ncbi:hypothetical protein NIES2135_20910 [Leptolyngbya boryana NIES-2135]|jgi:hypothetical protein|uniref:Uncharacterized protein n=2 Tax=Leptolyngbya boryana TaxID=1184 RepID=A0A1Z4JF25_LEPBY|nr:MULTISPECIES: hypothetical protein [Leptolyngbya]BAY55268.1 hypothetical protein NIES2135_20910 [Leptolyngbya boryana NIES-2135]MBD2369352.1 hypothetical protein [Leptolyngbya sp. FACHB-161]MBD2375646.1 hypothetical protein [Leptolyngbya sp. FACHB-238]MBD2401681.1 hypothetical protein [Leptolyngbya sp. FACHB-239]MBD2406580.1 hypothetical protein [Leptolyngbya sp. FACHB-402]